MSDTVTIIKGVEGLAVYVNDYRIAGPKPWGGGTIVKEWTVQRRDLDLACGTPHGLIDDCVRPAPATEEGER